MQKEIRARLDSLPKTEASFVEPMECLSVSKLPEGVEWLWEIKLDGYRALAVKTGTGVTLFSRRRKSLNRQFPYIVEALADLPAGTVVDGEVVAIDDHGRPDFNLLQNFRAEASRIQYYVFDLLCWKDRDLTRVPMVERRALLKSVVVIRDKRIRIADYFEAAPKDLLSAVREQRLEGIIGKRKDSVYQPGKRSGAWIKYRVNRGQEFVIGGYFPGPHGIDSLIVGYYDGDELIYVARTRNGFVPASRRQVFSKLEHLTTPTCPFVNLPETRRSRFGEELNVEKMKKAIWLRPEAVAQIEFLEWTEGDRLRHSKFVGLREDKDPRRVVKERVGDS
ncbi:MAG TPA: non-homologous end-joining DNA ligase [Candidatus Binatus sp.]|jgi:DNA ligase D-like protein (predicted ligase)|nr:non-homologous end-joining DNA ligase [Candidatus Binatus sp.]